MTLTILIRQALLFGHVMFFAMALAAILKEDLRLLLSKRLDVVALSSTARAIKWLLLGLWFTGVPLVMMDVGTDLAILLSKPKLLTKITVVTVLTLNGILLHLVVFPMLSNGHRNPRLAATVASFFGAVSTASWVYASFVGLARIVAPHFSLYDFMALYVLAVMSGIAFAILLVRDRLERMLDPNAASVANGDGEPGVASAFREVETAIAMLGQVRDRLRVVQHDAFQAPHMSVGAAAPELSRSLVSGKNQTAAA
jgi:hypothetical protein